MGASISCILRTWSQSVWLTCFCIEPALLSGGVAEGDDADVVASFDVDEGEANAGNFDDRDVGISFLSLAQRPARELAAVLINESRLGEVELVFDEIGFALLLVLDEHSLILVTWGSCGKAIRARTAG